MYFIPLSRKCKSTPIIKRCHAVWRHVFHIVLAFVSLTWGKAYLCSLSSDPPFLAYRRMSENRKNILSCDPRLHTCWWKHAALKDTPNTCTFFTSTTLQCLKEAFSYPTRQLRQFWSQGGNKRDSREQSARLNFWPFVSVILPSKTLFLCLFST